MNKDTVISTTKETIEQLAAKNGWDLKEPTIIRASEPYKKDGMKNGKKIQRTVVTTIVAQRKGNEIISLFYDTMSSPLFRMLQDFEHSVWERLGLAEGEVVRFPDGRKTKIVLRQFLEPQWKTHSPARNKDQTLKKVNGKRFYEKLELALESDPDPEQFKVDSIASTPVETAEAVEVESEDTDLPF